MTGQPKHPERDDLLGLDARQTKRRKQDRLRPDQERAISGLDPELRQFLGELMVKLSEARHYGSPVFRRYRQRMWFLWTLVFLTSAFALYHVHQLGKEGRNNLRKESQRIDAAIIAEQRRADREIREEGRRVTLRACRDDVRQNLRIISFLTAHAPELVGPAKATFVVPDCQRRAAPLGHPSEEE